MPDFSEKHISLGYLLPWKFFAADWNLANYRYPFFFFDVFKQSHGSRLYYDWGAVYRLRSAFTVYKGALCGKEKNSFAGSRIGNLHCSVCRPAVPGVWNRGISGNVNDMPYHAGALYRGTALGLAVAQARKINQYGLV